MPEINKHRISKKLMALISVGTVFLAFVAFTIWKSHTEPWEKAFDKTLQVKVVNMDLLDNQQKWNLGDPYYEARSGHWLAYRTEDVPNGKPHADLWYDGRWIASAPTFMDATLSPDGMHYGYVTYKDPEKQSMGSSQQLVVDGKVVAEGIEIKLYHIPNDAKGPYYDCKNCNNEEGFFGRGQKLIPYDDSLAKTRSTVSQLAAGNCLYNPTVNVSDLVKSIKKQDNSELFCSNDGNYLLESKYVNTFPVGGKNELSLNNRRIDDGNTSSEAVNDQGRLNYLKSDGLGRGVFVIDGKRYNFGALETVGSDILYSEDRRHMAVILRDAASDSENWWADSTKTEAKGQDTVSLDGDTFYIYKRNF